MLCCQCFTISKKLKKLITVPCKTNERDFTAALDAYGMTEGFPLSGRERPILKREVGTILINGFDRLTGA
jgi:hypothetical protein